MVWSELSIQQFRNKFRKLEIKKEQKNRTILKPQYFHLWYGGEKVENVYSKWEEIVSRAEINNTNISNVTP